MRNKFAQIIIKNIILVWNYCELEKLARSAELISVISYEIHTNKFRTFSFLTLLFSHFYTLQEG